MNRLPQIRLYPPHDYEMGVQLDDMTFELMLTDNGRAKLIKAGYGIETLNKLQIAMGPDFIVVIGPEIFH